MNKMFSMALICAFFISCRNTSHAPGETGNGDTLNAVMEDFLLGRPKENDTMKHEDTEFYEPVPPEVTPGQKDGDPPSDAIILFNGKDLSDWVKRKDTLESPSWKVQDGIFTIVPGSGDIVTKQKFRNYQLHVEFRIPENINQEQYNGNSGLLLAAMPDGYKYEIQIIDSYKDNVETYTNGQMGSIYKQYAPLVNSSKDVDKWQSYDVIWTAPRFTKDKKLESPARVTVFQNGVLIQNNTTLKGGTVYTGKPYYEVHGDAPIGIQEHDFPVSFRNVWVRPLE